MEALPEDRSGAGNESTGSDVAGDRAKAHLVASRRDSRHYRSAFAALARTLRTIWFDSLLDRRRCRPSEKRVPLEKVEQVLGLYRDRYFDLNVRHFHEKLREEHRYRTQLYLGEGSAARSRAGGTGTQARGAS